MINTDKELSELFIYGIKDKDYKINDGIAYPLHQDEKMPTRRSSRSFAGAGNYLIITPSEEIGKDGQAKIKEYMKEIPIREIEGFTPNLEKENEQKLIEIYNEFPLPFDEKEDALLKLEKSNVEADKKTSEIITDLQKQLDAYLHP